MKNFFTFCLLLLFALVRAQTVDFENFVLPPSGYLNNAGLSGFFDAGAIYLPNNYDPTFGVWSGWAISSTTDTLTPGFLNQYSAIPGKGALGSKNYAVAYTFDKGVIRLGNTTGGKYFHGMYLTNSTYAYLSMRDGDAFAKKFGGPTGNDPDFFKVIFKKYLNGQLGSDSVEFYLADFRFPNPAQDYIVKDWVYVNLLALGEADSIVFYFESSDVGIFGINTPTYFCADNINVGLFSEVDPTMSYEEDLHVYPNPTMDFIWFEYLGDKASQGQIINVCGQVVHQFRVVPGTNRMDLSDLLSGMYVILLKNDEKWLRAKLIMGSGF